MNNRNIIIVAVLLSVLALLFYTGALLNDQYEPLPDPAAGGRIEFTPKLPPPSLWETPPAEEFKAKNIFHPVRGRVAAPAPAASEPTAAAPVPAPVTRNLLGKYPDDWPRLMLTGLFESGGRQGAIITGGDGFTIGKGSRYPRLYYIGDPIGAGIVLAEVGPRNAVIQKGNDALVIPLGVKPPDPPPPPK